jgi:hypothetical protein
VHELPPALQDLSPRELEDLLCLYKRELAEIGSNRRTPSRPGSSIRSLAYGDRR